MASMMKKHPSSLPSPEGTIAPAKRPLRLLLVEDCAPDAELIVQALSRAGYQVQSERVESERALTEALTRQEWDLVIADFTMPGFSGVAALDILRERDADLPFIFVSGTIGEDTAVAAMKTGAQDYLMKGNLARLVPAVERSMAEAIVRRARKQAEEQLAHLAYHDALTDLPNRHLLHDRLNQALLIARRESKPAAVLLIDLNDFKMINDQLGHQSGDTALQLVAGRLRSGVRRADTLARLGGDEFAVLLPSTDLEGAAHTARKLLAVLDAPVFIDHRPVSVRASIGIACFPEHGTTAETLLQKADVAMYVAKETSAGWTVYAPERDTRSDARLDLVTGMVPGLAQQEFCLEYQPIVDLQTGLPRAAEALVRWNHPTRGQLMPDSFIPLAERSGLIDILTTWVLERVLKDWRRPRGSVSTVAVNISPRSLLQIDFPEQIGALLERAQSHPSRLTFEITETVVMSDPARAMNCLQGLRRMGIRLAIDDFGTGYSSLNYLRRLPVDEIKIDRSFAASLETGDEFIVKSTIDLAHSLGLSVVAEGVESTAVRDRLIALGCDAGQGLFFCRPRPLSEFRRWLRTGRIG
jgi:diguanylate cyclase (GGDEF)-like protein